jgi:hypothetical protein
VNQLRGEERDRRGKWQVALRDQSEGFPALGPPGPAELLRADINQFVNKSLVWRLNPIERAQLDKARMTGPSAYGEKLVELADLHPITLPPADAPGVVRMSEKGMIPGGKALPQEWQQALHIPQQGAKGGFREKGDKGNFGDKDMRRLQSLQGRWPDFALAVHEFVSRRGSVPSEPLGPCRQKEFLPRVQKFIDELEKDPDARKELHELSGHWPEYPYAVMKWAKAKNKEVPLTKLPGDPEFWDKVRSGKSD